MKYLGIDYGTKQIGIALSDDTMTFAFPRAVIPNDESAISYITTVIGDEDVSLIIVGDTRALSGAKNSITEEAQLFIETLGGETTVPIKTMREGWSSVEAGRFAPKGKEHDDSAAATIILQRVLGKRKS